LAFANSQITDAQFYNGHQMTFGKNRVQYIDFYWQYYRFNKLDTYFYYGGRELAQFTGKYANDRISEIEDIFDYSLSKRLILIIYNKQSDFIQSNIGLITGKDQYNIGGVTQIVNNKVFLYFEGEYPKFKEQISKAIAQVIVNEMLYGNDIKDKVTNSVLLNLPEWYIKGLISYVAHDWSVEMENYVKDGILSNRYKKFNRLQGKDATYAGHSIWRYIAETYGTSVIPNILYLSRLSKNVESGFLYVLGIPLKDLTDEWLSYYQVKYENNDEKRALPDGKQIIKKPKKNVTYKQLKISDDGKYIAYVTNEIGKYKVWLYNLETNKKKVIYKHGHKLEQIVDYSYPVLAWHPTSKLLNIITEEKGHVYMNYYLFDTRKIEKVELFDLDKILSFDYADDGRKIIFSAINKGYTDLYLYNLASRTSEQLTRDEADDLNPKFINNSDNIIFSSNRVKDSLLLNKYQHIDTKDSYDLFIYDLKNKSLKLKRIVQSDYSNEKMPLEIGSNSYLYLSDKNGIYNSWKAQYDSTITAIDTSIHYRYFTTSYPITNYKRNILEQDFQQSTNRFGEVLFMNGKYSMFSQILDYTNENIPTLFNTEYKKTYVSKLEEIDSLALIKKSELSINTPHVDSIIVEFKPKKQSYPPGYININNYTFDYKGKFQNNENIRLIDSLNNIEYTEKTQKIDLPKQLVYFTNFYTNYLVSQIDYSFLNSTYQPFTGGEFYFNPGFNVYNKIGTTDLFEDYKITAGVRFDGNFQNNEYLISIEMLKHRLDREIIFHRQSLLNVDNENQFLAKILTHELFYILKFPFSQVASLRGTTSIRFDRDVKLSIDSKNLSAPNEYTAWSGVKLEFVYDDTKPRGLNFYNGTRLKIFGEYYKKLDKDLNSNLYVVGADIRHYQKIHRDLIWANRFAASSSFGNSLLIYYMGGVDNITMLFPIGFPKFDNATEIDHTKNWVYQSVATNMRGFTQNIRNGNNFALINSEIRWPVFRYFFNRPLKSALLSNFAIVGFADIGTAWTGLNPYKDWQAYNYDIIQNGPVTVTIDKGKDPIIGGVGWGLRSKILGYYVRLDWAWGIENGVVLPNRLLYLSFNMDF